MIVVAFTTVMLVAVVPPMVTEVAPVRLVPVIVTGVPPTVGPEVGLMLVKVGAGAGAVALVMVNLSKVMLPGGP